MWNCYSVKFIPFVSWHSGDITEQLLKLALKNTHSHTDSQKIRFNRIAVYEISESYTYGNTHVHLLFTGQKRPMETNWACSARILLLWRNLVFLDS